jgi:uncharacterized protein (TIGR02001 family)
MKMKQKLVAGAIALSAMAGFSVPAAHAEVSAAVGAANMYYWRGFDLGNGDAQVWGDLNASAAGFYGGIWGASGDAASGQEYDLYAGYGHEFGGFTVDLSVWSYNYPSSEVSPGDLTEAVLAVGFGPVTATYYKNIASEYGDNSYTYATLAVELDKFTLKYGVHSQDDQGDGTLDGVAHLDLSYAYNDKLTFTIGKVVDDGVSKVNDEAKFVVGFSLPIE